VAVHDFDVSLRHAAVLEGNWVGFRLAWPGLAGYDRNAFPTAPYSHSWTWANAPGSPIGDGKWGDQIWRLYLLVTRNLPNIHGVMPQPYAAGGGSVSSNDPALMLGWLRAFRDLPALDLMDADSSVYVAKFYGYEERLLESYEAPHDAGGSYLVIVDLLETTV
jgi:hypothetical protein